MKDVILITTPPEVLLAKMQNLPIKDWSDVIWFVIGVILLSVIVLAFIRYYEVKEERKEEPTETERNRRIMDSMMNDCENGMR